MIAMVYDGKPPLGFDLIEHLTGKWHPSTAALCADCQYGRIHKHRGFEDYLLDLADLAKGFRVLVVHPSVMPILENFVVGFNRGKWRGYDVGMDEEIREHSGYLAAKFGSEKLGEFIIMNPPKW